MNITITNHTMKYDYDCGPTSISILLSAYGVQFKPDQLIDIFKTTRKNGTPWRNMKRFLRDLDLFKIEEQKSFSKAKSLLLKPTPLLICWNVLGNPDYSHYSVIIQMDDAKVTILDPEDWKKFTEHELTEFKKCWKPYQYWSVRLVSDKKRKMKKSLPGERKVEQKGELDVSKVKNWISKAKNI